MAEELKLADVGEGMHEAEILRWLVKAGDPVKADQTVLEIQTDKAVVEIPAPITGIVSALMVREGQICHVGEVLATFEKVGATTAALAPTQAKPAATPVLATTAAPTTVAAVGAGGVVIRKPGAILAAPAGRKRALELSIDLSSVTPSGHNGQVTMPDLEAFAVAVASGTAPATKPKANGNGNGHSLTELPPMTEDTTPSNGHGSTVRATAPIPAGPAVHLAGIVEERKPLVGLRRRIAERMEMSWRTIPHCTSFDEVDGTELVALRKRLMASAEKRGVKMTYLPLIIKAVVRALKQYPAFNSSLDEQTREVVYKYSYHIGMATATPDGLLVPVLRDADKMDLITLATEVNRLGEGGRNRSLKPQELSGSTFTITNVGSYGGLMGTAIINPPEAAILAVGRLQERAVVQNGAVSIRTMLPLSLSFDHRLIDGAESGAFISTLRELLENPSLLLLDAI